MQPLDLGLGPPRLGIPLPGDSGQPPRVTRVVDGYQLHSERFQVSTGHTAARSDQSQPLSALPGNGPHAFLTAARSSLTSPRRQPGQAAAATMAATDGKVPMTFDPAAS